MGMGTGTMEQAATRTSAGRSSATARERSASERIGAALLAPMDIASMVVFRAVFGALMVWEMWRYWRNGWIADYYVEPTFHFTYPGFGWVRPLPEAGMYALFAGLALCGAGIALGGWYRLSALLFFVGYSYVFLIEQATYNNHYYLIAVIALVLALLPVNRALAVDARRRPALRSPTAPGWALWALRGIVGIPYFYGGLAKLKGDWLQGEPMRIWLRDVADLPLIGAIALEPWAPYLFSWGGLVFDLLIVPALLWRPTRAPAFALAVVFHLTNAWLFPIGVFPPLMIAATAIFLSPSWPREVGLLGPSAASAAPERRPPAPVAPPGWRGLGPRTRLTFGLLAALFAVQLLVPLRHFLFPGPVIWTEEGLRFAWHMRLRDKWGEATYRVTDPATGQEWWVDPDNELALFQESEMGGKPDMLQQYAHHLAARWRADGYEGVDVRVDARASLNGRPLRPLVDPSVDLAAQPRGLAPVAWILPLDEPLRSSD